MVENFLFVSMIFEVTLFHNDKKTQIRILNLKYLH